MSTLLPSLAAQPEVRSPALLADALQAGLPGPRSEAWKYTSLRALQRRQFQPVAKLPAYDHALLAGIPAPRLVFVNGMFDPDASDLAGLVDTVDAGTLQSAADAHAGVFPEPGAQGSDAIFATLNAALARDGLRVRVGAGIDAGCLHLVQLAVADGSERAWHLRHSLQLDDGAALTLVEHVLHDGAHAHLDNSVLTVQLGRRATLRHLRVQDDAAGATRLLRTDATLAREATYRRVDLELGGGLVRHEFNARLQGEQASVLGNGVLLGDGRRHVETRLGIDHAAGETRSLLRWRGLAGGRSRVVFHGGIHIHAGADGSIADLQNRNLLLSDDAEIDTQPVLEIDTDEVQAAHGATVGQLDPAALFYLRARGIPLPQARRVLTAAYCREVLSVIEDERLHAFADGALQRALDRVGA